MICGLDNLAGEKVFEYLRDIGDLLLDRWVWRDFTKSFKIET